MNSLIIVALLMVLPVCIGITCYSCNGCGDPFDKSTYGSAVTNSTQAVCYKYTISGAATTRGGYTSSSSCVSANVLGYGTFCCSTDLCNGSTSNFKTSILLAFGLVAFFAKYQLV